MRVEHGKRFTMIKLRTMVDNCEHFAGPCSAPDQRPALTWAGRIFACLHIDELPQLANVLLGHMSLIGPRPERPEFFPNWCRTIPSYRSRLEIRPQ